METISKPYSRYWWFASEIKKEDVKYNLDWLKENGFGGVEIAWVYPLNAMDKSLDSSYTPRQNWLSPEWQEIVNFTILYADSIGLACDLTLGTLWPFGDSQVTYEQASVQFDDTARQQIHFSWEYPKKGYVVDHLTPKNYQSYFDRMLQYFPQPQTKIPQSYFIDSWEVHSRKLWSEGFKQDFIKKYGYDISPFMDSLYAKNNKHRLYDYRKLISEKVIKFYSDFDSVLNANNIFSRGQCSGAPCDIISAYARLDIPEGESMLYEPEFNNIPASAAALSGKKIVSAETFTCLYGWPRNYLRQEQTADLKLVSDALFANGVNYIIWHGKPHNPAGHDSINFYATVHVGPDGKLAAGIPAFNKYLTKVSQIMKLGQTYADVAVYLPTEDAWIKGIMPKEKQFIWAWAYYEMRYVYFPEELAGYRPLWINQEFLEKAKFDEGKLKAGETSFSSLYIDSEYLDFEVLKRITDLAAKGLKITLKQTPQEAGTVKHKAWDMLINQLLSSPNVSKDFSIDHPPLVAGQNIPPFYARENEESLVIFFANPKSKGLKFPIDYGQSFTTDTLTYSVTVNFNNHQYDLDLVFEPYQSLLYQFKNGKAEQLDINFIPATPTVKSRPKDYEAPWLIK